MNFEFKIQNISNLDINNKKELAITHTFEIENAELIAKKGKLIIAISIKTNADTNLQSALRVFLETIKDSYYSISDETPLSALESAVGQGLRMLYAVKTNNDNYTLGSREVDTKISFSTALIWNRVLYTNYYGGGIGYILRGSGIRDISSQNMNPNEIWTNSSILDNEDVVIIGTNEFAKSFPANTIVENFNEIPSLIAENPNRNLISATFIKLTTAKNVKEKTTNNNVFKSLAQKGGIADKILGIKELISKTERLSDRFKIYQKKKVAPVSSISGIIPTTPETPAKNAVSTGKRINKVKTKTSYKKIGKTAIGVLILSLVCIGGYYTVNNKKPVDSQVLNYATVNEDGMIANAIEEPQDTPVSQFKDLHTEIINLEKANINGFSMKDANTFIISDTNTNSVNLYSTTDKSTKKIGSFSDPDLLTCDQKLCYVTDSKSLMVFESKENANIDKYLIENTGETSAVRPYNNRVYILGGTTIYQKMLMSEDEPAEWIKDGTVFNSPIDFAIDGNIYVLDTNKVIKLYGGKTISEYDFSSRVNEGTEIEVDIRNIYILDKGKRMIYVFNKQNGEFVKEIALTDEFDPSIPKNIYVFEKSNTSTLYFLKNNKIFKVE